MGVGSSLRGTETGINKGIWWRWGKRHEICRELDAWVGKEELGERGQTVENFD